MNIDITRAHPRSRGEHPHSHLQTVPHIGSSPLTRGALLKTPDVKKLVRLIPAHAGSTQRRRRSRSLVWGSSPLTRGAPSRRVGRHAEYGLIPAHAGSTPARERCQGGK